MSADRPEEPFQVVVPRRTGIEYGVSHHDDRFFITTNDDAPNFRLVCAPVSDPLEERLDRGAAVPARRQGGLAPTPSGDHLVVYEREAGLRQVADSRPGLATRARTTSSPSPSRSTASARTRTPSSTPPLLRFTYTSMVTPSSVVDYDMAARSWTVRKQTEVLGGYDPARYRSERLFATAPDGTRVPISLVYQLPLERDGPRPLWLNGYGAYGISFDPSFSSNSLTLLDRGFVVAIAHVRGGEEMGRRLVRARKAASTSATASPTSSPRPSIWWRRGTRRPTAW